MLKACTQTTTTHRLRRNRDVSAGGLHADPQVSEYSASDEDGFASPCKVQMKRDDPYPRFCTCGACRKCFFLGSGGAGADADAAVLEEIKQQQVNVKTLSQQQN